MRVPCLRAQLDHNLSLRDRAKYRRQTELYKEWKEKVYETIQSQINQQLSQIRTEDIFVLHEGEEGRLRHSGYMPSFAEAMIDEGGIEVGVFL